MSHPRILLGLILCSCIALATGRLAALPAPDCWQEPENETFTIAEIELQGAGAREAQIRAALSLRVGEELTGEQLMSRWRQDVDFLWSRLRVRLEGQEGGE